MSDLQAALLVLGAVIIVTVLIYNKWQENRYRKAAENDFARKHDDALLNNHPEQVQDTAKPSNLTTLAGIAHNEPHYSDLTPETAGNSEIGATTSTLSHPPATEAPFDHCVILSMKSPIDSSKVIEAAVKLLSDFNKLTCIDNFNSDSNSWRSIEHGEVCEAIRGCVQLVDRRGCIDLPQLERFDRAMRTLARQLDASTSGEGVAEALKKAKDLDAFCAEVDIKVGLNVISSNGPFTGDKITAAAAAVGLELGADGGFHRRDASARSLFRMSSLDNATFSKATLVTLNTRAITFEVDVPRTAPDPDLVSNLFDTASKFADKIGGRVVDDNHVPVGELGLSSIRSQIEVTYNRMQERGFPAGEPLALRLFS